MLNKSLTAPVVFYRTYSRRLPDGTRESWLQMVDRTTEGMIKLGDLTQSEIELIKSHQLNFTALTSGRWQWVGGTEWVSKPENYQGAYNCSNITIDSFDRMAYCMDLLMQGCGVGTVLESETIANLPPIHTQIELIIKGTPGDNNRKKLPVSDTTTIELLEIGLAEITIGDSRKGWTDAYYHVLDLASQYLGMIELTIDLSNIRAAGMPIKGFGGVSNPVGLRRMFSRMVEILKGAVGRQLNSLEVCLLLDETALAVVAGNVRRSANIRQFSSDDPIALTAKDNLWIEDKDGNWKIDPKRDALRMGNHTRVFHHKPTLEECIAAVQKQYHSGEGAIQWAGESIARANADLFTKPEHKQIFIEEYNRDRKSGEDYLSYRMDCIGREWDEDPAIKQRELNHRMSRYGTNPCGEIILNDNFCNLSEVHLNLVDPYDFNAQEKAFKAAALSSCVLLNHKFNDGRMQYSREVDPIVAVSFTGLFDFFVNLIGVDWLKWWEAGRPRVWNYQGEQSYKFIEQQYLSLWREVVERSVKDYCSHHNLKIPNRCTTVQPAGTKSLLTGASPGWHPPKAQRFIRRITFRKDDPVALACIDYGYSVIPSQSDKDENGNLLDDAFDPRCTEWLIEIPVAVSWADIPGADEIEISKFSALAQFDFYMGVQQHYVRHNTSATIEIREHEIEELGSRIYDAIEGDEGYISAALLARFDDSQTFPRLPFEPIDKTTYDDMMAGVNDRRKCSSFDDLLRQWDMKLDTKQSNQFESIGPMACDSDKCMMPDIKA